MSKWIAEFDLEDDDTMPEHMDLNYMGAKIDFHCRPMWIPVSKRMPEEHKWLGTERFGTTISDEVYVTLETPDGERFTKHLSFQNGGLSRTDQERMKVLYKGAVPIAWMPLPEPYKEVSE